MAKTCYAFMLEDMVCSGCYPGVHSCLSTIKSLPNYHYYVAPYDHKVEIWTDETDENRVTQLVLASLEAYQPRRIEVRKTPLSFKEKFFNVVTSSYTKAVIGMVMGLLFFILSFFGGAIPLIIMMVLTNVAVVLIVFLGWNVWKRAFRNLMQGKVTDMDVISGLNALTLLALSLSSWLIPSFPMMLDAVFWIFGFRYTGLIIKQALGKRLASITRYADRLPKKVMVFRNGEWQASLIDSVQLDEKIQISGSTIIPLDGILETSAMIYDTVSTGGFEARSLEAGSAVLSGMRLSGHNDAITLRVTKTKANSYLAHLDRMIVKTWSGRSKTEDATHGLLKYFLPLMLGFAITAGVVATFFFPISTSLVFGVSLLSFACACTMNMIVPLAFKVAMNKAEAEQITFQSLRDLEQAATVDTLVLDIDGTINTGESTVLQVHACGHYHTDDLIAIANTLEEGVAHRVARTLQAYSRKKNIAPYIFSLGGTFDRSHHAGIQFITEKETWAIGDKNLMRHIGVSNFPEVGSLALGQSVVYIAKNQHIEGYFVLAESLRQDALKAIQLAQNSGLSVHLCTGAEESVALRYAEAFNISKDQVVGGCTGDGESPTSKMAYIKRLQLAGKKVAMVGDTDNDALALAQANFGMVIQSKSGSSVLSEKAGAVLPNGSLMPMMTAFAIAKQMRGSIRRTLAGSLGFSMAMVFLTCILFFTMGFLMNPGLCAGMMVVQLCLVAAGFLYFRYQSLPTAASLSENVLDNHADTYPKCLNQLALQKTLAPAQQAEVHNQLLSTSDSNGDILSVSEGERFAHSDGDSSNTSVPSF